MGEASGIINYQLPSTLPLNFKVIVTSEKTFR